MASKSRIQPWFGFPKLGNVLRRDKRGCKPYRGRRRASLASARAGRPAGTRAAAAGYPRGRCRESSLPTPPAHPHPRRRPRPRPRTRPQTAPCRFVSRLRCPRTRDLARRPSPPSTPRLAACSPPAPPAQHFTHRSEITTRRLRCEGSSAVLVPSSRHRRRWPAAPPSCRCRRPMPSPARAAASTPT